MRNAFAWFRRRLLCGKKSADGLRCDRGPEHGGWHSARVGKERFWW